MLVLSRKVGEKILIGGDISVTVVRVSGGGVRIGIEAPSELAVVREELADVGVDSNDDVRLTEDAKSVPAEINRANTDSSDPKSEGPNQSLSPKKPR